MHRAPHIALVLCLSLLGQPALALFGLMPCAMSPQAAVVDDGVPPCHGDTDEPAAPVPGESCASCDSACMQAPLIAALLTLPHRLPVVAPDLPAPTSATNIAPAAPLLRPPIVRAG
jgi:hypothetical protein